MTEEDLEIIDLNEKTDLTAVKTKCPQCGNEYFYGVPYVNVACNVCGITYRTDFRQDIFTKKARFIEDRKTEKNGIIFKATEEFKPALIHIRYNHLEQKCWDVSEIGQEKEEIRFCFSCGICLNCLTCKSCGVKFERDINRKKQKCPECHKSDFARTYFKDAKIKEGQNKRVCPECGSENIKLTLTKGKDACHRCGSKNLSEKKINNIYTLTVTRKKGYMK